MGCLTLSPIRSFPTFPSRFRTGGAMSIIILIAVVVVLGYYLSLRIHPTTRCKRCDSSTRHYDLVYSDRRRGTCPSCGGTGRQERFGTRFFR